MTIVTCPGCGTRNRLKAGLANPTCGVCHAALPVGASGPVDVSDATFARDVLQARGFVLVDFWAAWCGPCRMQAPVLEAIAAAHGQHLTVAKLDTDRNQRTAASLGVQGLPTLALFRDGQLVGRRTGLTQRPQLEQWLRELGALPSRAT